MEEINFVCFTYRNRYTSNLLYVFRMLAIIVAVLYLIELATKRLQILSLGDIDKIRNHLVANQYYTVHLHAFKYLIIFRAHLSILIN